MTDKGTPALDGKAIRKQVTISFSKDPSWPKIHLLIYLPAAAHKPVPMFFTINFSAVQNAVDDPGITPEEVWNPRTNTRVMPPKGRGFGRIHVEPLLDAGFGVATYYYGDVDPDYLNGFRNGIRARYLKPGQTERAPDDWGSIAAWAWGMSRVEDYFETDKSIDAKRVAIHGVSRLGKTVMWAGAHDQRFAAVIASCSGEGGAALSHRDYGETIAHLTAPTRYPYQFAENYAKWGGISRQGADGCKYADGADGAAAAAAADRQHRLLVRPQGRVSGGGCGRAGLQIARQRSARHRCVAGGQGPILHDLAYYMHDGGHGMVPSDWDIYMSFSRCICIRRIRYGVLSKALHMAGSKQPRHSRRARKMVNQAVCVPGGYS